MRVAWHEVPGMATARIHNHTVPPGRAPFSYVFQATSCQVTIVQSPRDKEGGCRTTAETCLTTFGILAHRRHPPETVRRSLSKFLEGQLMRGRDRFIANVTAHHVDAGCEGWLLL
jgi:hypothetical protein